MILELALKNERKILENNLKEINRKLEENKRKLIEELCLTYNVKIGDIVTLKSNKNEKFVIKKFDLDYIDFGDYSDLTLKASLYYLTKNSKIDYKKNPENNQKFAKTFEVLGHYNFDEVNDI